MQSQQDGIREVTASCPICSGANIARVLSVKALPVQCNVLFQSREEALGVPEAPVDLVRCRGCGHMFNLAFKAHLTDYRAPYENSLFHSATFQRYAEEQARELIERWGLRNSTIVEIGAGDGRFLALLCQLGENRGIAFDPSAASGVLAADPRIEVVRDYYDERYTNVQADFVCCRQVLEHIGTPLSFLRGIRRSICSGGTTGLFFEVPNGVNMLHEGRVWDVIYEHYSYFSPTSLRQAFEATGFWVGRVRETFSGQYLCLEGKRRRSEGAGTLLVDASFEAAECDEDALEGKLAEWEGRIAQLRSAGGRVAIWGAGSKGITFLNLLRCGDVVDCVVDVNPRKRGMFVAGTGQQIEGPEVLKTKAPEVVLVANQIYEAEIKEMLAELHVAAEVLCL